MKSYNLVLVTGDRNWTDQLFIEKVLSSITFSVLLQGNARGADILSKEAAKKLKKIVISFPADWAQYKKAAGPIRNSEMIKQKPDVIFAFHDNLFVSKGTKHCVSAGLKNKIPVFWFYHQQDKIKYKKIETLGDIDERSY